MEKIHIVYFLGLVIIGIISTYVLLILPRGVSIPALEKTFFLFGLALNTIVLLWWIAGFLLYRWIKTGKRNPSLVIWSVSFFIYSITFVAHLFRALGYNVANENLSVYHFLMYRWGMIVWAAGILYGLLKILTENKKYQLIPSAISLILGFTWLLLGLFVIPFKDPIEGTMYLFLNTIWIPVCFTMSYIFAYYGYKTKQDGPKLVALGFFGVMISYYGWAPWHFSDLIYIYFIWYFIFLLSLTPILIGFIVMAVEEKY